MKALVFSGKDTKNWVDVPDAKLIESHDAVVEVLATTICGTDLHILNGDVPTVENGRILGHEAVGIVKEIGSAVTKFRVGDRVLVSCITSCGHCNYCKEGMFSHCQEGGGWILGHLIDGTQAELVRIPHADHSLHLLPESVSNADALMLSDILATGYEIGVDYGAVKEGDVVAVVGAGPVGLAAIATMLDRKPEKIIVINRSEYRMNKALEDFGATHGFLADDPELVEKVKALTSNGLGVDVAIEAVGIPSTWDICVNIVRPGGHIAVLGVHGEPVIFPLNRCWIENLIITTGLVNTDTTPAQLKKLENKEIDASKFITHKFKLDDFMEAYEVFSNAGKTGALKVLLEK
jgi:alcohol dehydrogenase